VNKRFVARVPSFVRIDFVVIQLLLNLRHVSVKLSFLFEIDLGVEMLFVLVHQLLFLSRLDSHLLFISSLFLHSLSQVSLELAFLLLLLIHIVVSNLLLNVKSIACSHIHMPILFYHLASIKYTELIFSTSLHLHYFLNFSILRGC